MVIAQEMGLNKLAVEWGVMYYMYFTFTERIGCAGGVEK